MAYRNFSSFEPSGWSIKKAKSGKNTTVVTLETGDLQIQTPVLSTIEDLCFTDPDLKYSFFKLSDDNKTSSFKEWLTNFDNNIVDLLDTNKEMVWGELAGTMSKENIEDKYKNSITSKGKIKIYLSREKKSKVVNLPIVDKDNKVMDITEIESDSHIISIIRCRFIRVSSEGIYPQWEMLSVNIKEDKPTPTLTYIIHDESDSDSDDFEIITDD